MKIKHLISFFILTAYLGINNIAIAQKTAIYNNPEAEYKQGIELFNKEKYGAAQKKFINTIDLIPASQSQIKTDAEYYSALCALELFNNDAEYLLKNFIKMHPENSKVKITYFLLGKFYYTKKKYKETIKYFEKVDVYDLSDEQLIEYNFKRGYSNFCLEDYDKSKITLYEIINKETKYTAPANYYYAHIAYIEGNYETALKGFNKLSDNELFSPIIPYYIVQIYFLQENYDELLKVAPALLEKSTKRRAPEIARLIGEAYYNTSRFKEAIPYLEMYKQKNHNILSRHDIYQLGYAYYRTDNFKKAISIFKNIAYENDSLTQNTYYHLADCYIKTNQKQFAYNSFLSAYKMNFDKEIKEDALFNYAKLAYELCYNPYNESINAFQKYIEEYPKSPRINEANRYLVNLYLSTRNYKNALFSIEKIKNKSDDLKIAYQKITYFRGVEYFNDGELDEAIELFDKSLKNIYNKTITAESYYWKAEAYYRLEKFDLAIKNYNTFLLSAGAFTLPYYNTTNYNLGYAHFKKKNYSAAIIEYRKFLTNKTNEEPLLINDAYLRTGDSYFVTKDFSDAIEYYDKAIELKLRDTDYALYQKSLSLGVLGQFDKKSKTLTKLADDFPLSTYSDAALFELAKSYLILENNEKALQTLTRIIENYPADNNYVKKSLLKKGLVYFNNDNNDLALNTLKKIVIDYPGTPESKEALVSIRNIYINLNKVEEFFVYVQELPFAEVSDTEQDSITYLSIEKNYMNGDCEKSTIGFKNYIEKFPFGAFITDAYFYKAECDFRASKFEEALKGYNFVSKNPITNFSEKSELRAAYINFKLKNYEEALKNYIKLEKIAEYKNNIIKARAGQMECNFLLENYSKTIEASEILLSTEKISNELINQAHITIAKSAMKIDSIALAQTEFEVTAKLTKSEIGAEAKYYLALIQYNMGNYKQAETISFDLISQIPSYEYWVVKCFILLADIHIRTDNTNQAKATLQSIIDNYDGSDLVKIAHMKLNSIIEAEKAEEKRKVKLKEKKQDTDIFIIEDDEEFWKVIDELDKEEPLDNNPKEDNEEK